MKFKQSTIPCPVKTNYHAINMNDKGIADLVIFGYIRDIWKLSEFSDVSYPPDGVIKLMVMFYSTEYIHLIAKESGDHWKVALDDILQSC